MKNVPFTTIKESQELIELGFAKWTASCKYIPTGYIQDTMMVVSGSVDQENQIPAWSVGDLIESLPPVLCNKGNASKLEISLEGGCWTVSYGSLFKANHLLLKEALLSTVRHVFKKYDIRTRKEVFNLFFNKSRSGVWLSDEEHASYFLYIGDKLKELAKTHQILLFFHLVSSWSPGDDLGWHARLDIDKDGVARTLSETKGTISEEYWRLMNSSSDEFITTFAENNDYSPVIDDKNPIESGIIIRTE